MRDVGRWSARAYIGIELNLWKVSKNWTPAVVHAANVMHVMGSKAVL
jgi:hypothetical protein